MADCSVHDSRVISSARCFKLEFSLLPFPPCTAEGLQWGLCSGLFGGGGELISAGETNRPNGALTEMAGGGQCCDMWTPPNCLGELPRASSREVRPLCTARSRRRCWHVNTTSYITVILGAAAALGVGGWGGELGWSSGIDWLVSTSCGWGTIDMLMLSCCKADTHTHTLLFLRTHTHTHIHV